MEFNDTINTGITPNDGQGDGLRTNIRKLHDNTKHNKQRLDDLNGTPPGIINFGGVSLFNPIDAAKLKGNEIGALKLTLPFWTYCKFLVKINLFGHPSSSILYLSINCVPSSNLILIESAFAVGNPNFSTVRAGVVNDKVVIYIGELNYSFSYGAVLVDQIMFRYGYSQSLLSGWEITEEANSFQSQISLATKTI